MTLDLNRMFEELDAAAARLVAQLQRTGRRIVFAESCTAGLVAATLARVPGVSEYLCGSAVVYRETTKAAWLNVDATLFRDPSCGVVSGPVAEAMCCGVLDQTPEADIAAAITGHLGPDAPPALDGVAYLAVADRTADSRSVSMRSWRVELEADGAVSGLDLRRTRQQMAALRVLEAAEGWLAGPS